MKLYEELYITIAYLGEDAIRTSLTFVGPGGDVGDDDFL